MTNDSVFFEGTRLKVYSVNTVVIGAGAAGLNAALTLFDKGQKDIVILTDFLEESTTFQSAAPEQLYGKLALWKGTADSPLRMAKALTAVGSMDGDMALTAAASSQRSFQRLAEMGVDFPVNQWGEYPAKDPEKRCSSAGPQTARKIQEALMKQVREKDIQLFEGYQVVRIFTDEQGENVIGLLALNRSGIREGYQRYALFNCTNVVAAAGAPAGLFSRQAYPARHGSLLGMALEAGVRAVNLTDWQFGLCGKELPILITGPLLAAEPRLISVDSAAKEFLKIYIPDPVSRKEALKRRSESWGFEVKKVRAGGSALIDLVVWEEQRQGLKVYLDFTHNS